MTESTPILSPSPPRVFSINWSRCNLEREPLHHHDWLEWNLTIEGHARRIVDETVIHLRPGDLTCLPSGTVHALVEGSATLRYWVAWLPDDSMPDLSAHTHSSRHLSPEAARRSTSLFAVTQAYAEHHVIGTHLIPALAAQLHMEWTRSVSSAESRPLHTAVKRAMDLLQTRYGTISLEALASQVGLSRSRLRHVFSEQLGITLTEYRNRCRLYRFDDLREHHPDLTLAALAEQSGFNNYMQFYRTHCRVRGTPPSAS